MDNRINGFNKNGTIVFRFLLRYRTLFKLKKLNLDKEENNLPQHITYLEDVTQCVFRLPEVTCI